LSEASLFIPQKQNLCFLISGDGYNLYGSVNHVLKRSQMGFVSKFNSILFRRRIKISEAKNGGKAK
jgi:hypothetical protein